MKPDLLDLQGRVMVELGQLMDALDHDGATYARAYSKWVLEGGRVNPPFRPPSIHSCAAKAIREIVLDEATVVRLDCRPVPVIAPTKEAA